MKKINSILTIAALGILTACGTGNSTTTAAPGNMNGRTDTTGTMYDADVNTNTNTRVHDPERPATTTVNRNSNDDRQALRQQMYSSLNMTDDQIRRYETASKQANDTWKKNNPNKNMSTDDMRMQRDSNLKPILNESQYTQYQQWSRNNPNAQF